MLKLSSTYPTKIKIEFKEVKTQLFIVHLLLINEIRQSEKSYLNINTLFQNEYPFKCPKQNPLPLQDIKITKKSLEKEEIEQEKEDAL